MIITPLPRLSAIVDVHVGIWEMILTQFRWGICHGVGPVFDWFPPHVWRERPYWYQHVRMVH
jgi:hypothetical protein